MKRALLSCQRWPDVLEKERAFATEFPKLFEVEVVVWDDPSVNWTDYNYLIFRTIWDYFEFPNEFAEWLDVLKKQNIKTLNPLPIIERNQHKFYLRDLQNQGIDIIPTVFLPKNTGLDLSFMKENNWNQAVIKPAVSGGAYLTQLFSQSDISDIVSEYASFALENDLLVQPFMSEIQETGELSLLFFQGKFSHAIVKKPKNGDFRVQSQFGGQYHAFEPDAALLATAQNIIDNFGGDLLYARVDGIVKDGQFLLMELELIEPDLYFDYHPDAKNNYFAAVEAMVFEKWHK